MATKRTAPKPKSGSSNNSMGYSPKDRAACLDNSLLRKGGSQISDGGLQKICKDDPEKGTTDGSSM